MIIGVIGGQNPPPEVEGLAERVGELIARRGAVLICGGLTGVMEAACRGAKKAGGLTIGVLPTADKRDANAYVDVPIVTAMSTARNVIIVRTADALIAVDGSYGTLSEIAHALDLRKKIVALHSWPLVKAGVDRSLLIEVSTPEEAVDKAIDLTRGG